MNIDDLLAEQDSDFISLNSLILKLMHINKCSYKSGARYLYRLLKDKSGNEIQFVEYSLLDGITKPDYNSDDYYSGVPYFHIQCLSQAATDGAPDDRIPWRNSRKFVLDDFERYGFIFSEIKQFLLTQKIELPNLALEPEKQVINAASGWREQLGIAVSLTDVEICRALSDIDPCSTYSLGTDESRTFARWTTIVSGAISSQELNAEANEYDSFGNIISWSIKMNDLYQWCTKKMVEYPFYIIPNIQHESIELAREDDRELLSEKDAEILKLQEENASLKDLLSKEIESGLPTESTSKPRTKQIRVISVLAQSLFPDPLSIPNGGKAKLESICVGMLGELFTKASFQTAWNVALAQELVRTEKHDIYSGGSM